MTCLPGVVSYLVVRASPGHPLGTDSEERRQSESQTRAFWTRSALVSESFSWPGEDSVARAMLGCTDHGPATQIDSNRLE